MKTVLISPYSKKLRNEKMNPKNYPYWVEVVKLLKEKDVRVVQVGMEGEEPLGADEFIMNKKLKELSILIANCDTWASVDNFFQHLCYTLNKKGVAIFGQSDPNIFGHATNVNLLKDPSYLRQHQFHIWEQAEFREDCFVSPDIVVAEILKILGG